MLAGPVSLMPATVTALSGVVLVELLLLDWRRVPFTCSYLLGKGAVPLTLLKGVFSFVFFTNVGAALARVSRTYPGSAGLIVIAALLATVVALRRLRRHLRTEEPLEYEDTLPSEMNPLRLSPD
jgi:lipoprotein signal peptidase